MKITLHFAFEESDDKLAPVTLPPEATPLVPHIGDSIAIRKGYYRIVKHRHFLYEPGETHVMLLCH